MQSTRINLAKEELLKGLREAEQQVKTFKELLEGMEAIEKRAAGDPNNLPPVREGEFRGKRAVEALDSYLRARREFRIPLSRVVADLVEGGVDPGQPRGKKTYPLALVSHTLKIAIPNRRTTFRYNPDGVSEKTGVHIIPRGVKDEDITVWLAETADEPKRRKRSSGEKNGRK